MNSRTAQMFRSLRRFGVIGAGVAASVVVTMVGVNASEGRPSLLSPPSAHVPIQRRNFPNASYPTFRKWDFNWDGMQPGVGGCVWPVSSNSISDDEPCAKGEQSKAARHIILVRHGQYNNDGTENDDVHTLTDLGEKQAVFAGKKLDSMGVKFTSITSSAMIRAKQTACIVLKNMKTQGHLKLEVNDPLLSEGVPCVPEPPYKNLDIWNPNHREVLVEGSRIEAGFRKYFHRADPSQEEDSWEIIVCHGNVIRYFACRALQFPPEGWLRIGIDHCSITRFTILPSGDVILRGLGDSGYIPHDKATI